MTGAPPFLDASDAAAAEIDRAATDRMIYALWALFWVLMMTVAVQDVMHSKYIRPQGSDLSRDLIWGI